MQGVPQDDERIRKGIEHEVVEEQEISAVGHGLIVVIRGNKPMQKDLGEPNDQRQIMNNMPRSTSFFNSLD